jgi:hypothetical protein
MSSTRGGVHKCWANRSVSVAFVHFAFDGLIRIDWMFA